jgi:hypothetical protein
MSFNNNNSSNEDDKRRLEIAEDLPAMRSVMIGGAVPAMPLRRTFHEPLVKGGPSVKLPPQLLQTTANKTPIIVGSIATITDNDSCHWKVVAALDVPSYYDFERTHTRVKGFSALEVSKRIDDCLRAESFAASFDNEQVRG